MVVQRCHPNNGAHVWFPCRFSFILLDVYINVFERKKKEMTQNI